MHSGIINTIVDGVITIDSFGNILDFNRACERLFGYAADEVLGRNVKMLMPDEYEQEHDGYLDNYKRTGERKIIGIGREVIGRRKDETTFPMELSVGQIDSGGARAFVGVIRDITDRKRLEQGLRDSDAQYRAIIETAVDGMIIIDALGTVRMYNPACEAMFGFSAEEVIGNNVKMLMPSPYYDEHDKYLMNYSETGERKIIGIGREVIGRRKDGTTFPMELSVGETRMGGNLFFVGILRDITRSKNAEEALRRSQAELEDRIRELEMVQERLETQKAEMEALAHEASSAREEADDANRTKSEFLAAMSHEIRTPMNAVIGFANLLADSDLPEKHRENAMMIRQGGEALMSILNDILDLSKIEAGHLELESLHFHPQELVDVLAAMWSAKAESQGLAFETALDEDVPDTIVGDPSRLRQVLFNLVSNALKFTEKGGVTVTVRRAGTADRPHMLRWEVRDTGIGIAPDRQAHVFGAFAQADAWTSRKYGGTGLGLNICKRLIDAMGGRIGVDSVEGEGSTFWFTIDGAGGDPALAGELTPPELSATASGGRTRKLKILCAEDNEINQRIIRTILEKVGHDIDFVLDGTDAIAAVEKGGYDVVLMDVQMPNMDGPEAARRIRRLSDPVRAQIPIIALTANAMQGDRESYLASGMDDYVAKPIDARALNNALIRVLEPADDAQS